LPPDAAAATKDNAEVIQRLLLAAESARFGISVDQNSLQNNHKNDAAAETYLGDTMKTIVRPSVHSYPSHASLAHSISADKSMDTALALQLYQDAAALGSSRALNELGEMYLYGEGSLQQNHTLAARYFNRSADLGDSEAQHNLAILAYLGLNSEGKPDEAVGMLQDFFSAMGDNPLAKLSLGYRHLFGINAPKSCEAAVAYYSQVSEAVVAQSLSSPVSVVLEKARLADEKSRTVAPEEDEDVIQYYQHSAENGDVGAQVALGHLHFYGARGFEQNPERAARYFRAAAAQGDTGAMSSLGQMHVQGLGVSQNNETAFQLLSQASERNNPAAQNGLGYLYLHGQGTKQDYKLALKWFKRSADQGNAEAQFNLGAMYFAGLGVDKKYVRSE
jgi:TPR repeat protein